jgi:hypothetical protein
LPFVWTKVNLKEIAVLQLTKSVIWRIMDNEHPPANPAAPDTTGAAPSQPMPKERHNGWNRHKMALFLEVLTETACVSTAAKSVGMSRQSAYRLRARLIGQPFDLGWEAAFELGLQQLAHRALDRALNGTAVPIFYKGEQVGERRVFNERATLNLLLHADRIGRNPVSRDYSSRHWDALIRRVEHGPIIWTEEEQAGVDPDHPANSDYDYDGDEDGDDDEYLDEGMEEPDEYADWERQLEARKRAEALQYEADRFAEEQSHYARPAAPEPYARYRRRSW